jgi:hypothetical protein
MATTKMMGVLTACGIAAMAVAGPATAELPRVGATPIATVTQQQLLVLPSVSLACSGSGASDVKHRGHSIKNTAGYPIPKGTSIHWTSSDKGSGSLKLATDLAPNASVDVIEPGQTNGYTCNASFYPGTADYTVKSVSGTATTATIVVSNLNPWVDAPASQLKVDTLKCFSTLVGSVTVQVPAIPKGGSVTVTAAIAKQDYLQATANANNAVSETNKTNNTQKSIDFSTNKSCTPQ